MKIKRIILTILTIYFSSHGYAQMQTPDWAEDRQFFDPTGLDLHDVVNIYFWDWDDDGQSDVFLRRGDLYYAFKLEYYHNRGIGNIPRWQLVPDFFASLTDLDRTGGLVLAAFDSTGMPTLIANRSSGERISLIAWQNIGTIQHPQWQVDTTLFYGIDWPAAEGAQNPSFGDLDQDGDLDFIIGKGQFYPAKELRYFENIGSPTRAIWQEDSSVVAPIAEAISANYLYSWWGPTFFNANGDAFPDLLLAVSSAGFLSIKVLTCSFTGRGVQWQPFDVPVEDIRVPLAELRELQIIDMNDDGLSDLVINGRRIYPNMGSFAQPVFSGEFLQFGGMPATSSPFFFDYKHDGRTQLLLGEEHYETFQYFFNAFDRVEFAGMPLWKNTRWLGNASLLEGRLTNALIDLFGDGILYLISWGHGADILNTLIYCFQNTGNDSIFVWQRKPNFFSFFTDPSYQSDFFYFPAFGDLDGDDDQDVLVQKRRVDDWHRQYQFYENRGRDADPLWKLRPDWETGAEDFLTLGYGAALADLDGDGDLDITFGTDGDSLLCLVNVGDRTQPQWRPNREIFRNIQVAPWSTAAFSDMDADGKPDMVVSGKNGFLTYYRNETAVSVPSMANSKLSPHIRLWQNYPNPFNAETFITYEIPRKSKIRLTVYNLIADLITVLVDDVQQPGQYRVVWQAGSMPSGLYFYELSVDGKSVQRKKFVLIR